MKGIFAIAAGMCILFTSLAWSQQTGDVVITSSAEVEMPQKDAQGRTVQKLVPATHARIAPGTEVIFTTRYTNKGSRPATGVVITNPVPEHMTYMDRSAAGKGTVIAFSVDGGSTYSAPASLMVTGKDGRKRPALPTDYTHIQWTITTPLAPGASGSVMFRAQVK